MGKGNRGFKPQGIMNPILMARLSRPVHTEKTTRVRLDRELRPSWEEVKGVVFKKQTSTVEFLEKWENDHYREELKMVREAKRGKEEDKYIKKLASSRDKKHHRSSRKSLEKKNKTSHHSDSSKKKRHSYQHDKKKETNVSSDISDASSVHSSDDSHHDRKSHSKHKKKKDLALNPYKFSNFLNMKSDFD